LALRRALWRYEKNAASAEITRTPPIAVPTPAPILFPVDGPWLLPETALGVEGVGDVVGDEDEEGVPDAAVGELVEQGMYVTVTPTL
jgi:hypothetical protein